jgi:hypothetical protein
MESMKIKILESNNCSDLETEIQEFIKDKFVMSIHFSTHASGVFSRFCCMVSYFDDQK